MADIGGVTRLEADTYTSPSELNLYQYQSIQEDACIRLLTLLPSKLASSDIRIKLSITPLSDTPPYEATSYTWATKDGDSSISSSVVCEGAHIKVTRNCVNLLQTLRREDTERALWVDAICIDQTNMEERCYQIMLMGEIYTKAARVVIWLGDASEAVDPDTGVPISDLGINYLTATATELRKSESRAERSPFSSPSSSLYDDLSNQGAEYVIHRKSSPLLQGFLDVVLRPWWERVWVVQEAALAESAVVICGDRVANYADFYLYFTVLSRDEGHNAGLTWSLMDGCKSHMLAVYNIKDRVRDLGPARAFRKVMSRSRRLRATDKRDHIFAVLDTFGAFKSDLPFPDYTKSTAAVFGDMTERMFRLLGSLDVLLEATNTDSDSNYPSWVPDFSRRPQFHIPANCELYHACGKSRPEYSISHDCRELKLLGKCIDVLEYHPKTADLSAYKNPYIATKSIPGYQQSCLVGLSLSSYSTGEDIKEVVWRTLCWNVDVRIDYPATPSLAPSFDKFHEALFSGKHVEEIDKDLLGDGPAGFNDICVHSMPLGITAKKYLASAPWTAREGDIIVLFAGAHVPFVLRRNLPLEEAYYSLIGACYVHGIMDGEAFPQDEAELHWFGIK
ncbi:uncharacterized protein A1O5_07341 [Cladophialophora psammophila CBS 110553]|uniref:Heterokaryon incompatibility domain-containing protein n=1 Tax=Cladophialophora psammophila CBS 110553 TaxID=1182543 RepID=W9WW66_9EURO|nr:uncharacterized protein A1O5_07341 [Cladophialophora psammophila CBS 110553]EXJ69305.1 hypothetical protein A1O5_07341 [Cladophialophora psammophila CBS 110553]